MLWFPTHPSELNSQNLALEQASKHNNCESMKAKKDAVGVWVMDHYSGGEQVVQKRKKKTFS